MKPETIRRKLLSELHKLIPDLVDRQREGEDAETFQKRFFAAERSAGFIRAAAEALNTLDQRHLATGVATELREYQPAPQQLHIGAELVLGNEAFVVRRMDRKNDDLTVQLYAAGELVRPTRPKAQAPVVEKDGGGDKDCG